MKKALALIMSCLIVLSMFSIFPLQVKTTDLGAWDPREPMPTPRSDPAAVSFNGKIWVIGGINVPGDDPIGCSTVEIYDPLTDSWTTGPSMPAPKRWVGAVVIDSKIYVVGDDNRTFRYDSVNGWIELAQMPIQKYGRSHTDSAFGVGVVDGKMYVACTRPTYDKYWTYCYDPSTNNWSERTPIPYERTIESFAEKCGKLYGIGGSDAHAPVDRVDIYDPETDSWELDAIPWMLHRRTHLEPTTPVICSKIYVIDGYPASSSVDVYDQTTNTWTTLAPMPTPRWAIATAVVNGKIYAIGGNYAPMGWNPQSANEEFTPPGWTPPPCMWCSTTPLPNPSCSHHCAVHDNRIYVVGGSTPTDGELYDRVLYGSVDPHGHIDPDGWQYTTEPLPPDDTGQSERVNAPVVVYKDWIYVLDGSAERPPYHIERDTVCFASIGPNGDITEWTWTTSMPYRGCEEAVQWNGKIYIMAGWDGYSQHDDVYYAAINPADGSLGLWMRTTTLPREYSHGHATAVHNGVIYFIGGNRAYPPPPYHAREVYYSIIQESGELGPWIETAPLPVPIESHDAVVWGDDLFVIGGRDDKSDFSDVVYKAHINPDGSLDSWEEYCRLPESLAGVGSVCLDGRIYAIGGYLPGGIIVDTVYFTCLVPLPVPATLDIDPDTLNLKSNGQWITAYIELPEEYSPTEIDVSSILLNGSISVDPEAPTETGDYDADGIPDLMVKFDRASIIEWLGIIDHSEDTGKSCLVTATITGKVLDMTFEGSDTIKVLRK